MHLHRAFGYFELPKFDPFLMLDDFSSSNPRDYAPGFPWHPHRGIETVTYMIAGSVRHEDSLGNKGAISDGAIQWMSAGSGILHQEMPDTYEGRMTGFQLWVNLPESHKMMSPRYRDISPAQVLTVEDSEATVRVVAGTFKNVTGPVADLVVDTTYFDVSIKPGKSFSHAAAADSTAFIYVFDGAVAVGDEGESVNSNEVALLVDGESVELTAGEEGARLLFASGRPLGEPIAWHGPIVMNTDEEIRQALEDLNAGTFVK